MNREERIAKARQMAEATREERERKRAADAVARAERLAALGPEEARSRARELARDKSIEVMGPEKTPSEWIDARQAIRNFVIAAARARRTITYGEIRIVD